MIFTALMSAKDMTCDISQFFSSMVQSIEEENKQNNLNNVIKRGGLNYYKVLEVDAAVIIYIK